MTTLQRILDKLSQVAPNVFQAEVAAGLAYATVVLNLRMDDSHKAAYIGLAVLAFTLIQGVIAASKPSK